MIFSFINCPICFVPSVGSYQLGNDFKSLTVRSSEALARAESNPDRWQLATEEATGQKFVLAPGGYKFVLEESEGGDKLTKASLATSDLDRSIKYWSELLQMKVLEREEKRVLMSFGDNQV
jgi:hypothetical protein